MKHVFRSSNPGSSDYACLAALAAGYLAAVALVIAPREVLAFFAG